PRLGAHALEHVDGLGERLVGPMGVVVDGGLQLGRHPPPLPSEARRGRHRHERRKADETSRKGGDQVGPDRGSAPGKPRRPRNLHEWDIGWFVLPVKGDFLSYFAPRPVRAGRGVCRAMSEGKTDPKTRAFGARTESTWPSPGSRSS